LEGEGLKTKIKYIILMPLEILTLFLLSYEINYWVSLSIVNRYIIPNLKIFHPNIGINIFIGLISSLITFIMIICLGSLLRKNLKDFGFNFNNIKFSFKAAFLFIVIFMILYIIFGTLAAKHHLFDYRFNFPLNAKNFTHEFLFQLLISGGEELYFRCFTITILEVLWKSIFESEKKLHIVVVSASTFIFVLRHIGMTFMPFVITYLVPLQLVVVTVMGLFFGYIFIKTKSVFGAYLAHGVSNACIYLFLLTLNVFMR
jgi:membrane protease YdiL (CAAX protease family)